MMTDYGFNWMEVDGTEFTPIYVDTTKREHVLIQRPSVKNKMYRTMTEELWERYEEEFMDMVEEGDCLLIDKDMRAGVVTNHVLMRRQMGWVRMTWVGMVSETFMEVRHVVGYFQY
jgi:hypothetical protein